MRVRLLLAGSCAAVCALFAAGAGEATRAASGIGRDAAAIPAQVVIVSNRDGDKDVYTIRADGRRAAALTRNRVADGDVVLSPAGGWVALSRSIGVVLVRADGRQQRRLGPSTGSPTFSPDGRWLAFSRETSFLLETSRVELVEVGTARAPRKLGSGDPIRFSADGRRLAFADDDGNVGVLDVASGRRTVVATSARLGDAFPAREDWSPQLAGFVIEGDEDLQAVAELVYVASRSGARPRVLERGEFGLSRAWLDDRRLGYDRRLAGGRTEIVVARVDRSGRRVIARGAVGFADWAPGGSHVAYTAGDGRAVVIASTTTTARRTIQVGQQVRSMSWSPSGRRLALTVDDAKASRLLIVDPRSGTVLRRLAGRTGYGSWSPDETSLAAIGPTGVELLDLRTGRNVTAWVGGDTQVVGWLRGRQPPNAPLAATAPPTEVASATGFQSRTKVLEIAADGAWVGALLASGRLDRSHVVAWTAPRRTTVRFAGTSPEGGYGSYQRLSFEGMRLRWTYFSCGNDCYLADCTADVRKPMRQSCGEDTPTEDRPPAAPPPPAETKRGVSLAVRNGLVELRHADGRSRTIRPPGRLADAELEDAGLFYAYNTSGSFPGRLVFVRFAALFP